jgi:hypothetical protein
LQGKKSERKGEKVDRKLGLLLQKLGRYHGARWSKNNRFRTENCRMFLKIEDL